MPPPERFRALMVTLPASRRSATARRTATSYVAVIARLVRWTEPGTMAVAEATDGGAVAGGASRRRPRQRRADDGSGVGLDDRRPPSGPSPARPRPRARSQPTIAAG